MRANRNRANGWKHAKLSGHKNESLVEAFLKEDGNNAAEALHERLFGHSSRLNEILTGGLHEKNVPCILGGSTKSKSDLFISWRSGNSANISIKKSVGGQAYLISCDRFIAGMEAFYGPIQSPVKDALRLYFGPNADIREVLRALPRSRESNLFDYQIMHGRLVWSSLTAYKPLEAKALLNWLKSKQREIFLFCFSHGLARDPQYWADIIWYINLLNIKDEPALDTLVRIKDVSSALSRTNTANQVNPGAINGGSTIQLPFGFVQWHQKKLQFHYDFNKFKHFPNF